MGVRKCILTGSFDFEGPSVRLVPLHRRGVDDGWLRKHASYGVFSNYLSDLRPIPKKTVIHVIAVGDDEAYGPNRNFDGFSREDNRTAHKSFKDIGHVFRHHQNDDPFKAVGDVLQTAHNELMSRIELLLALDNEKCRSEVEAANKDEEITCSMGCFTAGHRLTLDDGSTILLEDAKVGDRVLTHTGAHKPVTHVFEERRYTGTLYRFSARALEDIEATAEHPFFVVRSAALCHTGYSVRRVSEAKLESLDVATAGEWVAASAVRAGDYLVSPVNTREELPDYMSIPLARVLGYYAAKGHARMTPDGRYCSVQFSLNKKDAAVTELPQLFDELGISPEHVRIRDSTSSPHRCNISVSDSELTYRCSSLCGCLAKKKRLDPEMMLLPVKYQLAFLGALINGDGCAGAGAQEGALYISTASEAYRDQLRVMLMRVGVTPGYSLIRHRAGKGRNTYSTTEHQIYIPRTHAPILAPYTVKGIRSETPVRRGGSRLRVGNYILTPVSQIETREVVEEPIYNVEVADDNSYVINGVGVHNSMQDYDVCSLCGHRAPTAQDHCDHIKKMLGLVLSDGRRIYMKNPNPKFFDISLVWKPADRIAYMLRKVASDHGPIGGHDLAELFGLNRMSSKIAVLRSLASLYKETPATLHKVTGPAPLKPATRAELRKQAQIHGVDHLLAFLSANKWLLGPGDFANTLGHENPAMFESAVQHFGGLQNIMTDQDCLPSPPLDAMLSPVRLGPSATDDLNACCSMEPEPVQRRVIRLTIMSPTKVAGVLPPEPEARAMALLYSGYKVAFAEQLVDYPSALRAVAASF